MQATHVAPEVRRGRGRLAATVVLGHCVKHIYNSGLRKIVMPELKIGLGLTFTQVGLLVSARSITGWLTTLGAGYLGDRFSSRAALFLGLSLGIMGASLLLAGYATSFGLMLAAMLIIGVGPALYHPPAIGELSRRFPDRRGFAISLHGMGGIAGEVIGPLVAAGALRFLVWRDVLKLSVFPALLAAFAIWAVMRTIPRMRSELSTKGEYFSSLAGLLGNRMLVLLVIVTALRSMGESAVDEFLPIYLREDLQNSTVRVAVYFSTAQVAAIVVQPAMGYLSDRLGHKAVLIPAMVAGTLTTYLLSVVGPGPLLVLAIVVRGAFKFSVHHILIAAAIDSARGHVQSIVVSLIYGASIVGTVSPWIAGVLSDEYGVRSAFVYGAALSLLATVVLLRFALPKDELARGPRT